MQAIASDRSDFGNFDLGNRMATLGSPSPPSSPRLGRKSKSWARKCERYCCSVLSCFPLVFVYGLTSWAVWVEASIGFLPVKSVWTGHATSVAGIILYLLLNWSYTVAVFTDPGSPLNTKEGYSHLPTEEDGPEHTSFTVKSSGDIRYCKKCQVKKPDRAHHCSTCGRCVLKMDHHCPWLATCVGLRNYKPFLLFIVYTSVFCWLCFAVAVTWVWSEIFDERNMEEMLMPINYILLSVLAGIIGLVLSGFTIWHLYLASTGQTTIESLEKTRYLTPIRKSLQKGMSGQRNYVNGVTTPTYGQQLAEIHANAIPGVTREEEGDVSSPAMSSLRSNYNDMERARERDRYEEYLDEQDSEKLPNAFNLGLKGNLSHVFGRRKLFWFFPICNTTGDGWRWEASKSWIAAREDIARERQRTREQYPPANESVYNNGYGNGSPSRYGQPRARQSPPRYQSHGSNTSRSRSPRPMKRHYEMDNLQWDRSETANWNDVPDDMFSGRRA